MTGTDAEQLKKTILYVEKVAHSLEARPPGYPEGYQWDAWTANVLRIAAACMWEKLERIEKEAGHVDHHH